MIAAKRVLSAVFAVSLVLMLTACEFFVTPPPAGSVTLTPAAPTSAPSNAVETQAPTELPTEAPTLTPTPAPTPTPEPAPTAEAPDAAGSGSVLFDIYQSWAQADINSDGAVEDIRFTSGKDKSVLEINGTQYDVPKPNLAQTFAITDIDTTDKYMELVFTDAYNADLADSEKAFSWMYWWNGSKLILMGGLMDVKFAGGWRSAFKAEDCVDGKGQVSCLTNTEELTDIWYIANYRPAGVNRKLSEYRHTAAPVGEVGKLTCKTVCLIQTNHDEVNHDDKYANSEYDYYWITNLAPTTLGRVLNPMEGIKVIVRPGETLTITGTYGKTWFKVKTDDGLVGWIYCKGKHVGAYNALMGWTADDMFDGLTNAG